LQQASLLEKAGEPSPWDARRMSHIKWTPKMIALSFVACFTALLFISALYGFWEHTFQAAILRLVIGLLLFLVFFRHRRWAFSLIALCFILVMAGPGAVFRPTLPGIITTLVAGALFCGWIIWGNARYPNFKRSDFKKLFDRDPD
jgi:hypothetical protein